MNAYSWSQPTWVGYHYILEALKTQSPQYIVLEAYGMLYGHSYIMPEEIDRTNYNNSFNLDMSINRLRLIATSKRCGLDLRDPKDFLYLPRYHSRWKDFDISELSYDPHDMHDFLKGYNFMTGAEGFETPQVEIASEILVPYEYCVEYLDRIVDLCREKDIKLILTLTPYIYDSEETGVINWLEEYCRQREIPFFNYLYGEDCERSGFDYSTDLADRGHCNYSGAEKITMDLSAFLHRDGADKDKRQHPYRDMLEDDWRHYVRVGKLNEIMSVTDISEWLKVALADENVTVMFNRSGNAYAFEEIDYSLGKWGIIGQEATEMNGGSFTTRIFDTDGTVTFAEQGGNIEINGTRIPGPEEAAARLVLYDKVLGRPVQSVWIDSNGNMDSREFTSDVLARYRKR